MTPDIYLDNQATTRCDPRVVEEMRPYWDKFYGNPSSKSHSFGWIAEAAVQLARERVASSIGGQSNEIVFCSGATEANNLALWGVAHAYRQRGKHVLVAATEHASILDTAKGLATEGWSVTELPVDSEGLVRERDLIEFLRPDTTIVSVMLVNNEIGVIQDIASLAAAVHRFDSRILVHCDAAQALGKIPVNVTQLGIDMLSVSAHKIYGPKGVGALWRRRRPRVAIQAQIVGGGHEWGLRSGTLPTPLLVGFGVACQLVMEKQKDESLRIGGLTTRLMQRLEEALEGLSLNGGRAARVPGNLNIAIDGIDADRLLSELSGVALSTGSACASASGRPSHVLAAITDPERARSSIRIGVGRFTTQDEIDKAAEEIIACVRQLRS